VNVAVALLIHYELVKYLWKDGLYVQRLEPYSYKEASISTGVIADHEKVCMCSLVRIDLVCSD
jgi:hypothetical protein